MINENSNTLALGTEVYLPSVVEVNNVRFAGVSIYRVREIRNGCYFLAQTPASDAAFFLPIEASDRDTKKYRIVTLDDGVTFKVYFDKEEAMKNAEKDTADLLTF